MRFILLTFCILSFASTSFAAGKTEVDLRKAAESFDRALERRDTAVLNKLLSPKLRYAHSNTWIESKEELKANLFNGKLIYTGILPAGSEPSIIIEDATGLVRSEVMVNVVMDGTPMNFHLNILQVWIFQNGEWRLIARHSTKVG
jgi:hypothetical protein